MKIVPNWRASLTHYSTQALAFGGALQGAWMTFPVQMQDALGADTSMWVARVTASILAAGLLGKFIDQSTRDVP